MVTISKYYSSITKKGVKPSNPGNVVTVIPEVLNPADSPVSHNPVTIGSPANGLSLAGQVLTLGIGAGLGIDGSGNLETTGGGSKWTDIGSDIYRNSRVLVGATAFSSSIPKFEVIGGDAYINEVRIGRGGGDLSSNTANGEDALTSNTSGDFNTANGYQALFSNTTGSFNTSNGASALLNNTTGGGNTANGYRALFYNTTGSSNTANGVQALLNNTTGSNNTASGLNAGQFIAGGSTALTITNNSVFLGVDTRAAADNQTNQIVIGHTAIGSGSNTATLGNTSIIKTILRGTINMAGLPTSSAGLVTGDVWNNSGVLNII